MVVFKILSKMGKVVNPDEVRTSVHDASALLFYKLYKKTPVTEKYLTVVIKPLNREGFIVTAFFTDRVKKSDLVWRKKP
ncbi:MAG: hypothetical protein ACP5LB_06075 [Candidatus Bathyarchaeia archaeon]